MEMNNVVKNWFWTTDVFDVGNKNIGSTDMIQFCSTYLEELKYKGIEIHYELHFTEGRDDNLIRLCCHAFPYSQFSGDGDYREKLLAKYSQDTVDKILAFREAMRKEYIAMGKSPKEGLEYYQKNNIDFLGLIWTKLPKTMSEQGAMAKVAWFISETYETLVKNVEKYKSLL